MGIMARQPAHRISLDDNFYGGIGFKHCIPFEMRGGGWDDNKPFQPHRTHSNSIRLPARGPHHSTMEAVLKEMRAHPAAWPFQKPVNTDEVKDYLDVVKKPMDLSMMDFKLENNSYALIEDFIEDAKLMLDNCKLYNPESTVYHKTAIRMEKALQDILKSVGVDYRL
ncbi:Acetyltransferase (GNAT) domain [Rhizoctonia solani]|uniref:Acetyltransferase (GNAT) domain n=1 Tax=Rhizoctonia solani TaxID=456999 RepID=A0A8H7IGE2_9AGAM|nr:Acetyltransferase (GNAT) domain [Rhizoctonia solani]